MTLVDGRLLIFTNRLFAVMNNLRGKMKKLRCSEETLVKPELKI